MNQFYGKRKGGFAMTYSTLASIVKYPFSSTIAGGKNKFGFFASEEEDYASIADELGIMRVSDNPLKFARYPLVYLVEAADDICYQVMDIEDAHKLHLITTEKTFELLLSFFDEAKRERRIKNMNMLTDVNEQIAYLRASVIGLLVNECSDVFINNEEEILAGTFKGALIDNISITLYDAYKSCSKFAYDNIYFSKDVLDIELAGYRIIGFLLEIFTNAILKPEHAYSKLLLERMPKQYKPQSNDLYTRLQSIVDFVSGMTDVYALDLYRKITGMGLPSI